MNGEGENSMIEVTKINGVKVLVNPDLIELVEEDQDNVTDTDVDEKPPEAGKKEPENKEPAE